MHTVLPAVLKQWWKTKKKRENEEEKKDDDDKGICVSKKEKVEKIMRFKC